MMSSFQTSERDRLTVALFKRICHEKAQERELLKCPRCDSVLEAIPLDTDDKGDQNVMWICKNTADRSCHFPLDMPTNVFWVKRTPQQQEEGVMPRPNIQLLPEKYKFLYPSLFPDSCRASVFGGSRCASSNSGTSSGSGASLHTRDMSLSSNMPSPTNSNYGREREFSATPSVLDGDELMVLDGAEAGTSGTREAPRTAAVARLNAGDNRERDHHLAKDTPSTSAEMTSVIGREPRPSSTTPLPAVSASSSAQPTSAAPVSGNIDILEKLRQISPKRKRVLDERLGLIGHVKPLTPDLDDNGSTFDSDEEAEYGRVMEEAERRAAVGSTDTAVSETRKVAVVSHGRPRSRQPWRRPPEASAASPDGLYAHLLTQLDSLDLETMEDEELTALVEKVVQQVKATKEPLFIYKEASQQFLNRNEYAEMSRESFQNIDFSVAGEIASKQPKMVRMSMPFTVRRAANGNDVLAAVGATHRGVKRKQPLEDCSRVNLEDRVNQIVRMLAYRKRENRRQLQRAVQTNESEASLRGVRANTKHLAARDRERLETDRAQQMQLEQEHKTKQLVKAKIHAIKEAKRQRLLAQQQDEMKMKAADIASSSAVPYSPAHEELHRNHEMASTTSEAEIDDDLAGSLGLGGSGMMSDELAEQDGEADDLFGEHHALYGDHDDLFSGDMDLFQ